MIVEPPIWSFDEISTNYDLHQWCKCWRACLEEKIKDWLARNKDHMS